MSKETKIEQLQDIIKMASVNGDELEVAQYFQNLFEEVGIESQLIEHEEEGRASLLAELSGSGEGDILALTGHFDVVAVDDPDDWDHHPFQGQVEDGKVYGRGTADMKAGLLGLALAMIELKEEDFDFDGKIRFIGTAGEEIGMLGSRAITEQGYTEDLAAMIVGEPVNPGEINTSHKGSLNYDLVAQGRASHSSTPDEGINAVMILTQAIERVQEKMDQVRQDYQNDVLGETYNSFTVISGGTQANSIPEQARATANARTIPEFSNDQIIALIQETIDELNEELEEGRVSVEVTQNSQPVMSAEDSQLLASFLEVLGDLEVTSFNAVTDASNFTAVDQDFSMVIYGPGHLDLAHVLNEYVEVDAYLQYIEDIKKIIKDYYKQ
ncbi:MULTISPECIES: ArgE/DapE family deacylase [Aerococcus]|uniref:Probable succinyl-diaminopimelate desuccinylase n=1 Tax=Aerococcus sanguinicola TaxID=119206 RepID=A0A5N1GPH9_9LACT|nr:MULTISPECIES: ArgE/DapE family deacylase [Aerococcus]KAA9302128.1 ArgE/DapE family deacylase [Aerococcus sanguinicola]MDK6368442.1 ArgE/DapE family deacylase [Aerococcus sp. UMB9870]MDK6679525.1 ArgE/DapE family deacylase [Aerococcus sp. UMB8608]MDK6686369.1 ArgE/DapE family deacylase [Aerococcus sp. UMB8623]MDK6941009.1 ArgE/DapE family deacylase [Aerococcus sp. UMB8487]